MKSRREQLEELLAEMPDDPFVHYGLAMEHVSAGQDSEALRRFQDLITRIPDYVPAYLQAGQTLLRLGRTDEARNLWRTGSQIARQQGDRHAADEMQGFIENLE
jgi:Flp pilus assembly protein TadD